jgi:pSer/pThr/pTyr-binding forkhead associated (FHA) protein
MSRRLVVSGGSRARELVLVDTLIVGRDPGCEISEQNDPLLSRRHAAFTADARHAAVRDLGSRNGILVNGTKVAEAQLRNGDVVQIGHLQVKFVDEVGPFRDVPFDSAQGRPDAAAADAKTKLLDNAKTAVLENAADVTRKL